MRARGDELIELGLRDDHAPSDAPLYDKLAAITFDENKKTAIYKFTNDQSHRTGKGFDPAIVAETQKICELYSELARQIFRSWEGFAAKVTQAGR